MASRYHSQFKEKKLASSGGGPAAGHAGKAGSAAPLPMKGSGFNKTTKVPVVKRHPVSKGIDA